MDARVKYIDIAKGISIFLVALFHSQPILYGALAHSKLGFYFHAVILLFSIQIISAIIGAFFELIQNQST